MNSTKRKPCKFFHIPVSDGPDVAIAKMGKCGSTALNNAIVEKFYPDRVGKPQMHDWGVIKIVMKNPSPDLIDDTDLDGLVVMIPVRDPVERFRSACVEMKKHPDEAIEDLQSGESKLKKDYHFQLQTDFIDCDLHSKPALKQAFLFPEDLPWLQAAVGLDNLRKERVTPSKSKPDLTWVQKNAVRDIYFKDLLLRKTLWPPRVTRVSQPD